MDLEGKERKEEKEVGKEEGKWEGEGGEWGMKKRGRKLSKGEEEKNEKEEQEKESKRWKRGRSGRRREARMGERKVEKENSVSAGDIVLYTANTEHQRPDC